MKTNKEILNKQISLNQGKNLFFNSTKEIMQVDEDFLHRIEEVKKILNNPDKFTELDKLVMYAADQVIENIYKINQFLDISGIYKEKLKKIYRKSLQELNETRDIKDYLYRHHYPALSRWLSGIYPEAIRKALSNAKEINSLICEEYSAEFQLNLLGIDHEKMNEPIIDIGCGKNGFLVKYLRSKRKDVIGIDRLIEKETAYLKKIDWNEFEFKERTWGTIISNMSFSNHLRYSLIYDRKKYQSMIKKLKELLNSLKREGEFIYAPAEPVSELKYIDSRFEKLNCKISDSHQFTKIRKKVN